MNIEVIKPEARLELPIENKVSTLQVVTNEIGQESLFVGFSNGDISVYKLSSDIANPSPITSNTDKPLKSYRSLNDIKSLFGKKNLELEFSVSNVTVSSLPVGKILPLSSSVVSDSSSILLAIGDSEAIRIHELVGRKLKFLQEFENSKNFVDFVYLKNRNLFIYANNKKKLMVYVTSQLSPVNCQLISELALKDRIKKISEFSDNQVIIGLANDFVVMNVDKDFEVGQLPQATDSNSQGNLFSQTSSSSFSYFGLNNSGGPQVQIIPFNDTNFILSQDSTIVTYKRTEKSLAPVPIASSTPLSILYLKPCYLVLLFPKKLEIVDYENGEVIQTFSHQLNSNIISAVQDRNFIYIGSGRDVFKFEILSSSKLVTQYLEKGEENQESKHKLLKKGDAADFKLGGIEKAISLVARLNEDDEYFGASSINAKSKQLKLRELYLMKMAILFEKYHKYHEALVELGSDWLISFELILSLFPDYLNGQVQLGKVQGESTTLISPIESNQNANVVKSISLESLQQFELNADNSGTDYDTEKATKSQTPQIQSKPPNIKKFTRAVNNLIVYLTDQRRIILNFESAGVIKWHDIEVSQEDIYGKVSIDELSAIVDTTLFLCYFHTKPMLLGPLLRLPNNHCDSSIVNKCLLQNLHLHTYNISSASTVGSKQPSGHIKELLDFYYGRSLHKEALEMLKKLAHDKDSIEHDDEFDEFLRRPDLTIQYLQKLDNIKLDLVFEYATWVLNEQNSIENRIDMCSLIFMNDSYECESYDSFRVLEYFTTIDDGSTLLIRYLEWLLFESDVIDKYKRDTKSVLKLHTRLCLEYLGKLRYAGNETSEENDLLSESHYTLLYNLLDTTTMYEPWTVLKSIPTGDSRFLRLTVLIYKRLNEHDKSIDILFNQLDDLDAAMSYCSGIYNQSHSQVIGQKLLHKLLEDLILANNRDTSSIEKLLNQEGSKMSILRVLTSLPETFPMKNLATFLTNTLRSSKEQLHDSRIATQLYKIGLIKLKSNLLESQREYYSIPSGQKKCSVCGKKLGYSIFSATKAGEIIHYGCQSKSP